MIVIDTDSLRTLSQIAQESMDAINEATDALNMVTSHDEWGCKERFIINENADKNRAAIHQLQEDGDRFCRTIQQVTEQMEQEERSFPDMFQSVESVIGEILSVPVKESSVQTTAAQKIIHNIGTKQTDTGSGSSGKVSGNFFDRLRQGLDSIRTMSFPGSRYDDGGGGGSW